MNGRSDSILELNDLIRFNGIRGITKDPDERYRVAGVDVYGRVHLDWSAGPDDPFTRTGVTVPYADAIAMLNDNVWELVRE